LGIFATVASSEPTAAQQGCELGPGSSLLVRTPDGRGGNIVYLTTPYFQCEDDVEIWADSAVAYSSDAMSLLIGRVRYRDRSRELTANEARYFSNVGRLQANGRVVVVDREDGSRVENGDLIYLRQTELRDEESMTVTTGRDGLRPRATIPPPEPDSLPADSATVPDSAAARERNDAPYFVVGDRIVFQGSSYFNSTGNVEIERDSLFAYADSAEYTETSESLVLVGSARVVSADYVLVGRTITMGSDAAGTNEVRALSEAVLTGEDLTLTAPQIRLYLVEGSVERLVGVPLPPRPESDDPTLSALRAATDPTAPVATEPAATDLVRPIALAESFELTADSLELTAPGGDVDRVFAAGRARSVSQARDSLNVDVLPDLARQDWLEGDTIVINLKPAPRDSAVAGDATAPPASSTEEPARAYEIETIVARVGARSLYRLLPQDSTAQVGVDPPAVHYVVGQEITIHMFEGEVEAMEVLGQTRGVHLEPLGRAATPADTIPVDSIGAQPPAQSATRRPS
jgi:lipopolysaccharide export system protein LptA